MKRKSCPLCHKELPLFMFSAARRIAADKDGVTFVCSHCNKKLRAISNEAHQKNFLMIVLVPLLFTPLFISVHQFIPSHFRLVYYFLVYVVTIMIVTLKGQHKMDIVPLEKPLDESLEK